MIRAAAADFLAGIVFLCGTGFLLFHTAGVDYAVGDTIAFDAAWFPTLLLSLGAIASLVLIGKAVLALVGHGADKDDRLADVALSRFVLSGLLAFGYTFGFIWLGYWVSTLIFMPLFSWVFGFRNVVAVASVTILFAASTWVIFTRTLHIQIPAWPAF